MWEKSRKTTQNSMFFTAGTAGGILPYPKVLSWDKIHHFGSIPGTSKLTMESFST